MPQAVSELGAQLVSGDRTAQCALHPAAAPRSVELSSGAGMDTVQTGGKVPRLCQARMQRVHRNMLSPHRLPPPQVRGCAQALDTTAHARRYRVCAMHLTAERVVVDGGSSPVQRYCRTCTSFHPLEAFDGAKRTCVRQLKAQAVRYVERQANREATAATAAAAAHPALVLPQLHATEAQQPSLPVTPMDDLDVFFHHWLAEDAVASGGPGQLSSGIFEVASLNL